jgi:GT2 family glycosyltransferase
MVVGGFDPLFFMYGEDDDMLERMKYHDIWFSLLPDIVAVHLRQSPPGRRMGWGVEFKRRTSRSRASLLKMIKYPGYSATYAARLVLAHGVIRPVADLVIDRQWLSFAAVWLASLQLAMQFRQIRRHTLLSRSRGPHFLNVPVGLALDATAAERVPGSSALAP